MTAITSSTVNDVIVKRIKSMYNKGLSQIDIANKFKCSQGTISNIMKKYAITSRTSGGATIQYRKEINEHRNKGLDEIIDGLMLGDGSINVNDRLCLAQQEDAVEWIKDIMFEMAKHGIVGPVYTRPSSMVVIRNKRYRRKRSYMFQTNSYAYLHKQRHRWYPNGKKIVPCNVMITPISLAHWFMGDGSMERYKIRLYTDDFRRSDVKFLVDKLRSSLGIKAHICKRTDKYLIQITSDNNMNKFKDIVKPYMAECFKYKITLGD